MTQPDTRWVFLLIGCFMAASLAAPQAAAARHDLHSHRLTRLRQEASRHSSHKRLRRLQQVHTAASCSPASSYSARSCAAATSSLPHVQDFSKAYTLQYDHGTHASVKRWSDSEAVHIVINR